MEAQLKGALNRIQELENKKLREQLVELCAEKIEIEKNWEEDNEGVITIIYELKNEIKELKDRMNAIENNDEIVYPEAETDDEAEWYDLKADDDYEILNQFPFTIRRKKDGKIATECTNKKSGYIQINLNNKSYQKHVVVAKHFIPNPNHLPIVDHINHIKTDYHVSNLRWVSQKENSRNKSSCNGVVYEYVDTIPDESMVVDTYGTHTFDNYYFHDNVFYFYTGMNYRKLHINEDKYGNKYASLLDDEGKYVKLSYGKFKKEHDIFD